MVVGKYTSAVENGRVIINIATYTPLLIQPKPVMERCSVSAGVHIQQRQAGGRGVDH